MDKDCERLEELFKYYKRLEELFNEHCCDEFFMKVSINVVEIYELAHKKLIDPVSAYAIIDMMLRDYACLEQLILDKLIEESELEEDNVKD